MNNQEIVDRLLVMGPIFVLIILALVVWSVYWKGGALWRSARNGDTAWFVVMLLINTLGILEIIYLYAVSKKPAVEAPKV